MRLELLKVALPHDPNIKVVTAHATASLIEVWIDETERRTWFLFEATRRTN